MVWHDDNELSRASATEIARHLDRPRKTYGVEVKRGHVWQCSLSLKALWSLYFRSRALSGAMLPSRLRAAGASRLLDVVQRGVCRS